LKPKTDTDDETREKLLSDKDEPKLTKSSTDNENREPNLAKPRTDTEEASRAKLRNENEEPMVV
jgi:hypothetical protein